jgi:hypothetical protein
MKNRVFWDVTSCDSCKNRRRNIPEDAILRIYKDSRSGLVHTFTNHVACFLLIALVSFCVVRDTGQLLEVRTRHSFCLIVLFASPVNKH